MSHYSLPLVLRRFAGVYRGRDRKMKANTYFYDYCSGSLAQSLCRSAFGLRSAEVVATSPGLSGIPVVFISCVVRFKVLLLLKDTLQKQDSQCRKITVMRTIRKVANCLPHSGEYLLYPGVPWVAQQQGEAELAL